MASQKEKEYPNRILIDDPDELIAFLKRVESLRDIAATAQVKILLCEKDAALLLSVPSKWLRARRIAGKRPFYYKLESCVRYNLFDLLDFIEECRTTSTSQEAA